MTAEERWVKIENALHALIEAQAQHNSQFGQINTRMERTDAQIEKNTAAIRDLIVVSRTIVDTQQATDKQLKQFDSEMRANLDRLVQTLDALFKRLQKPNGSQ